MSDVRGLGAAGNAVFQHAERLQKAGLINDAQFKELTNDKVGPQDVAIGNAALDKIKASTPNGVQLMLGIGDMNNQINTLQRQNLGGTMNELGAALRDRASKAWGAFASEAMRYFSDPIAYQREVVAHIK